jgi:AcrR family transcriptional regulator
LSGNSGLDQADSTGPGAAGRRALSRERIIETAIQFVDERGLTALTMRRLGKELDVEAMSLYRYVNGREDLLEGIVDHLVAQLHLESAGDQLQQTGGWQAYLSFPRSTDTSPEVAQPPRMSSCPLPTLVAAPLEAPTVQGEPVVLGCQIGASTISATVAAPTPPHRG